MKNIKRIMSSVLAITLLLTAVLTGCTVKGTPEIAATYGDGQELTTGQYLAYLYLEFENMYFNQGLYQYAASMDLWSEPVPLGENGANVMLADLITESAQENIKRQIVLTQMLKDKGLSWIKEDEESLDESLKTMEADAYLPLGFNNDSYAYAMKNANLNERSLFYGQYGKGGPDEIKEKKLKEYFEENYLSYKMISLSMTDKDGKELGKDSKDRKDKMDRLEGYLKTYEDKGFEAALKAYNKDEKIEEPADEHEGHDHEHEEEEADPNRVDADATTMDEAMVKAIRGVKVGKAKIVEFGTTAALVVRMDIHKNSDGKKDDTLYEDSVEDIIYSIQYEDFNKIVEEKVKELGIVFDKKVVKKCDPKDFMDVLNNM